MRRRRRRTSGCVALAGSHPHVASGYTPVRPARAPCHRPNGGGALHACSRRPSFGALLLSCLDHGPLTTVLPAARLHTVRQRFAASRATVIVQKVSQTTAVILRRPAEGGPTKADRRRISPNPRAIGSVRSREILRSLCSLRMTAGGGLRADPPLSWSEVCFGTWRLRGAQRRSNPVPNRVANYILENIEIASLRSQ